MMPIERSDSLESEALNLMPLKKLSQSGKIFLMNRQSPYKEDSLTHHVLSMTRFIHLEDASCSTVKDR